MRTVSLILLAFGLSLRGDSQAFIWSPDSTLRSDPNFHLEKYQEVLRYHDPIMYLTFPIVKPIKERSMSIQPGEGEEGYWIEGHLGYRFIIYKGKFYSPAFFQRTRVTLDVSLLSMLTRDSSSPILPFNNKFGFGVDFLLSPLTNVGRETGNLAWTTLQLHHYSNGQADTFFVDKPFRRNNYKGGDFSTNYVQAMVNFAFNSRNLLIASLGYQHELDLGGPLTRSKELKNYYGDGRLMFQINWITKPKLITRTYINRASAKRESVEKTKRQQFGIRSELEYLTGNLSDFPGDQKYRLGWHTYITFMPAITNEVGFIARTFIGRHYLNIRFDDVVFIGGLGFFVKFSR